MVARRKGHVHSGACFLRRTVANCQLKPHQSDGLTRQWSVKTLYQYGITPNRESPVEWRCQGITRQSAKGARALRQLNRSINGIDRIKRLALRPALTMPN